MAQNDFAIFKNVMVPMRDGIRLATDIYRPAEHGSLLEGKFPALLVRTSYNKEGPWLTNEVVDGFARHGYVLLLQDLRGRHQSEGTGEYFHVVNPSAGTDGYDVIEWIAQQPWSDGNVGMLGSSHLALTQTHAALYRPPHLKAIWPDVMPINSYEHQVRWGGAMQLHMFGALFLHAHDAQELRDDPAAADYLHAEMEKLRDIIYQTPYAAGSTPLKVVPNLEKIALDYYTRGAYDEFWAQEANDFTPYWERHADIPITISSGWYDPYAIAAVNYYKQMADQNKSATRLVMGPWTHGGLRSGKTFALDVDFGPESAWGTEIYNRERRRWFDHWLKGTRDNFEDEPPIRLFVMGGGSGRKTAEGKLDHGGRWRTENEWPLARTQVIPLFLGSNGSLSSSKDKEPSSQTFTYDPNHPVPTIAGTVTGFFELIPLGELSDSIGQEYIHIRSRMRSLVPDGAADQKEEPGIVGAKPPYRRLSERPDVLVFQTPPLDISLELTGPLKLKLWVSSSAVDTDFTAKLIDVYPPNEDYPDGYDMNIADGILRCRYRDSFSEEKLMEPGTIYPIEILLPPTSNLFAAGHRIRLDISSSNFPRFDLNPNTGEPMGRHTQMIPAQNTIYIGGNYDSHILAPIISNK